VVSRGSGGMEGEVGVGLLPPIERIDG